MKLKNYAIAVVATTLVACGESEIETPCLPLDEEKPTELETEAEAPLTHGMTVLGDKIPNAYTPENMREALVSLMAEDGGNKTLTISEDDIKATHLYLRFAPRDSTEVELLDNDSTIMYTVVPMDREIAEIGDYYHDPELPDSVPTYQYCVARIGQPLPDVPHETLSEIFLMEEANVFEDEVDEESEEAANKSIGISVWEKLEGKALELAGVTADDFSGNKSSKWRPEGYVKYYDNTLNKEVALEGVPVRIHRGFTTHQCCTDANGHFSFSKRRHHVRCYVKWRRDDFHLREIGHPIQQAESTIASHTKSSVNHTFVYGYDSWFYASVFRAAHNYYYHYQRYGLSKPKESNLKIRLSERTPSEIGNFTPFDPFCASDIRIFYTKTNMDKSANLYMTTVHEIAHCAHHGWDRSDYNNTRDKVKESWARGVEWVMAQPKYGDVSVSKGGNSEYTQVVRDLLDDRKLTKIGLSGKKHTKSGPCNISMANIEKALHGAKTWNAWRDNLDKIYPSKKKDIDEIFKIWEE